MAVHMAWCRHSTKDYEHEVFYTNDHFLFLMIQFLLPLALTFPEVVRFFLPQTFCSIPVRIRAY